MPSPRVRTTASLKPTFPPVHRRSFCTSPRNSAQPKANAVKLLPEDAERAPPYPYDHSYFYKQRNEGLYGGAMIQFGNNIGEQSGVKTRRRWHPNIVHKKLYSRALDQMLKLKVRTRVLRTIDKVGGLDEYLLGGTPGRLKEIGEEGWRLRWAILQTPQIKQRMETDAGLRRAIGAMKNATLVRRASEQEVAAQEAEQEAEDEFVEEEEEELDVEERMRQRLEEDAYMREQPPPPSPSIWQRITAPFGR